MRPLAVLIGAGASHASGNYPTGDRPPLTKQLFDVDRSRGLLKTYTLALAAGITIQRDMKADTTLEFEAALRRLQNDGLGHHRQMALAVPPFLQALLLECSQRLSADAFRYAIIVDELLKLQTQVFFVSLNYDTLLDRQLAAYSPLGSMRDYIGTPLAWSLLKPHGSVAWFVQQASAFEPTTPGDIEIRQGPIECVPLSELSLATVRQSNATNPHGPTHRYPALALPDGPKDQLVWPLDHHKHFADSLDRFPEISLLVLGYSALDTEILALIRDRRCKVRHMTVVNANGHSALEVYARIKDFGISAICPDTFPGSFAEWVDDDGLRTWVQQYAGPFTSLTDPDELARRLDVEARQLLAARQAREPSIRDRQL